MYSERPRAHDRAGPLWRGWCCAIPTPVIGVILGRVVVQDVFLKISTLGVILHVNCYLDDGVRDKCDTLEEGCVRPA